MEFEVLGFANKIISEFMGIVSHDLTTPITLMEGYTKLLLDNTLGEINEKQEKAINIIYQNIELLNRLRMQTQKIVKSDLGNMIIERSNLPINDLIKLSVSNFKNLVNDKNQEIIVNLEKDLYTHCDADKILNVISNYISNAIKYTQNGCKIEIKAKDEINFVHVSVKDNGRGIPKTE